MFNLFANVFTGFAAVWHGFFGGHATTTALMHPPMPNSAWMASSTGPMGQRMHEGSSTPGMMGMGRPGIRGTVSSVSGDTIIVSGKQGFGSTTPDTSFTVDATNANVIKITSTPGTSGSRPTIATSSMSVSDIQTGDTVMVQGTVSGASITATTILDGQLPMGMGRPGMMGGQGGMYGQGSSTRPMNTNGTRMPRGGQGGMNGGGNGQPPQQQGQGY